MMMTKRIYLLLLLLLSTAVVIQAQQPDRFEVIEQRLTDLAKSDAHGLNEKIDFSVSGSSIQEFLRGLAESNNLNISVDSDLDAKIYNNFTNEKVLNIIMFLVREHDLDVRFVGSIISISKYRAPSALLVIKPREISIKYNNYTNTIVMDLSSDTLSSVVKKITQVSKKNVIIASGIGTRIISVYVEDMPFDQALEMMCYSNQLKVVKTGDNFYVIKGLEEGEDPLAAKNKVYRKPLPVGSTSGITYLEVKDSLNKKMISIGAVNAPIADVIKLAAQETGINYFLFTDIKGTTTTTIEHVDFNEFLHYLLKGTSYTYKYEGGIYLVGDRNQEGLRAYKVIQFQNRSLTSIMEVIPAELKKGVEIKEFKELNSILLSGSYPQILEIEAFILQLDRVVPMVLIEVTLMDVKKGRTLKTGMKAGISDSVKSGGQILPGFDFTFSATDINNFIDRLGIGNALNMGKVSPNFYMSLSALETNSNVEVRTMPKLSTLNGHDANLSIGSTRYYSVNTQNVMGSLNPQTVVTQQWNSVQANLSINIKPVVSADDQVTLEIEVNISDFLDDAPPNAPPNSASSQFKSIVRVRNEDMIVLGGLERYSKSKSTGGIPILSRIPILKYLFSNVNKSSGKTITVVFIKPTIIY
jgi:type IV pilus assembly protein PilQ